MVHPGGRLAQLSVLISGLVWLAAGAGTASAQGIGLQGGVSIDPDQGYVGTSIETPAIAGAMHLRPAIEGGWGDQVSLAAIELQIIYKLKIGANWALYQGGGPAVNIYRFDLGDEAVTDTSAGWVVVFGFEHFSGLFTEFKLGGNSSPDLKFGVGWRFKN